MDSSQCREAFKVVVKFTYLPYRTLANSEKKEQRHLFSETAFNDSICFYGFSFLASGTWNRYGAAYITNMSDKILLLLHFRLRTASGGNFRAVGTKGGKHLCGGHNLPP